MVRIYILTIAVFNPFFCAFAQKELMYDVVIYGGTSAAMSAAVQIKKMGKSVVIVSPDKYLGGLS